MKSIILKIIKKWQYLSFVLLILLILILFTPVFKIIYLPIVYTDIPEKTDSIIILSAGIYNNEFLDFRTRTRIKKGVELYEAGYANTIICLGEIKLNNSTRTLADLMKNEVIKFGVKDDKIIAISNGGNTYYDLLNLYKNKNYKEILDNPIFVTSIWHSKRVKMTLAKLNKKNQVVASYPWEIYPKKWSERFEIFFTILQEYFVITYFKIKNWV